MMIRKPEDMRSCGVHRPLHCQCHCCRARVLPRPRYPGVSRLAYISTRAAGAMPMRHTTAQIAPSLPPSGSAQDSPSVDSRARCLLAFPPSRNGLSLRAVASCISHRFDHISVGAIPETRKPASYQQCLHMLDSHALLATLDLAGCSGKL